MRLALFILLFCGSSLAAFAQLPDFFREYISVELHKDFVEINGVYQLRNTNDLAQRINLLYPFPIDSTFGPVSNVYAFETANDSTINRLLKIGKKGAMIKLVIEARSEKTLYIGYQQKLLGNKAEYILITTQNWKKPLESSQIELIVPDELLIENLSYQPIDTLSSDGKTHYFIHKFNFMPEKNFVVKFKRKVN